LGRFGSVLGHFKVTYFVIKQHFTLKMTRDPEKWTRGMSKTDTFALYLKAVGYSKAYQERILKGIERFKEWQLKQGNYNLMTTSRAAIKRYHDHLNNRPNERLIGGLSASTIYNYLSSLSVYFAYQQQCGKMVYNPMSSYRLPKINLPEKSILSLLEIQQLYQGCENLKERCLLDIYYGLGLRRSEGQGVLLEHLDLKNSCLYVPKGKGSKGRTMPLTPSIQSHFKQYLRRERSSVAHSAFLLNQRQRALRGDSALKLLKGLLKRCNLSTNITLHSLRHSIATHLINQGMPLEQVRHYLGHSHLESTQRYIHYASTKAVLTAALHQG